MKEKKRRRLAKI